MTIKEFNSRDGDDEESNREVLPPDPPVATSTIEFKRGYLIRKCTIEAGGKKSKSVLF